MATKKMKGPSFLRFIPPIIETLQERDNSGTPEEVTDRVIERLRMSEAEQEETTSNGQSRVRNQIAWARFYLTKAGLIDGSRRGVWTLTEAARGVKLDADSVLALFKSVQRKFPRKPDEKSDIGSPSVVEEAAEDGGPEAVADTDVGSAPDIETAHRNRLLGVLRGLPAAGFERICKRLLEAHGFTRLEVTGRSGDFGIDGHGVLEVNPFLTFRVLFQCKRFGNKTSVTPSHVRDFRGAMQGRADKGLIMTTGSFTVQAKQEARRDGVPPIELVDGEKLVEMFEAKDMGLRRVVAFEIDESFFDEFKK